LLLMLNIFFLILFLFNFNFIHFLARLQRPRSAANDTCNKFAVIDSFLISLDSTLAVCQKILDNRG
jgi:hypothetical protein